MNFNPAATFSAPQFFGLGNIVDPASSVFGLASPNNIAVFGASSASAVASGGGGIFDQMITNGQPVVAAPTYNNTTTIWDAPFSWRLSAAYSGPVGKPMYGALPKRSLI